MSNDAKSVSGTYEAGLAGAAETVAEFHEPESPLKKLQHWLHQTPSAVPMIVLMLDGHPIPESYGDGRSAANTDELRRDLLEAQMKELQLSIPVRYQKISPPHDSDELGRHISSAIGADGISAFVFNFVDLLTHGRSESSILFEVAKDVVLLTRVTDLKDAHSTPPRRFVARAV